MSKKYFALLIVPVLILAVAVMALPYDVTATQLLGITITPTPTATDPPTPTATDPPTPTEQPQEPTSTPTDVTQPPQETPKPKATELVLLPETGEFPIDPAQGIQWFFALTMIFLIGVILFRTFRTARIKK